MLTENEILDIQLRNKGNADVERLLAEIEELKDLVPFCSALCPECGAEL